MHADLKEVGEAKGTNDKGAGDVYITRQKARRKLEGMPAKQERGIARITKKRHSKQMQVIMAAKP